MNKLTIRHNNKSYFFYILNRNKYDLLKQKFKNVFKEDPLFYARAPGRVNLIGEHIDYCGYSVLPMAIENDVVVAVSLNKESEIVLTNMEECFKEFKVNLNEININKTSPKWHDYFLSGVQGVFDRFTNESATGKQKRKKFFLNKFKLITFLLKRHECLCVWSSAKKCWFKQFVSFSRLCIFSYCLCK